MKKVSFMMIAAFAAASSMFVSCTDDEAIDHATISFDEVTDDKVTLAPGASTYTLNVSIASPVENLKEIKVAKKTGSETVEVQKPITSGFDSKTKHHLTVRLTGITEDCEIIVTVNNGTEYSRTLTIDWTEGTAAAGDIDTYTDKVLGSLSHESTAGSSCASATGEVFQLAAAKTNSAKVDFIYFNGATLKQSLAAPSNSSVASLGSASSAPGTWATKNATKLALLSGVTAAQFDAAADDALITANVTATAVSSDIVSNLAAGNVIGFITAAGKSGLIKVISIDTSSNANQSVKVTIKVQK